MNRGAPLLDLGAAHAERGADPRVTRAGRSANPCVTRAGRGADLDVIRDERGAIMLIAVFFATFAVAMLYLAIGAGEAVLFREHLQDAADSAALSAAITHARVMNMLVLINVIMAVLLAILVTLKLIEGIAVVGIAIAVAAAWFTGGGSLAAVAPLNGLRTTMSNLYEEVKPTVFSALELLHTCATNLAEIAPEASNDVVQADLADASDIASAGFAAASSPRLPVEPDKYEMLCGKAGGMVIEIAKIPLEPIPFMGELMGKLKSPMETLAGSLSEWFCGEGKNSMPSVEQAVERVYPRTDQTVACEKAPVAVEEGQEQFAKSSECEAAEVERAEAKADARGNCQTNCGPGGSYDLAVTSARQVCFPTNQPKPYAYKYQIEEGRVDYTWNGEKWVRGAPYAVESSANPQPDNRSPCGEAITALDEIGLSGLPTALSAVRRICKHWSDELGQVEHGYNLRVHPSADPTTTLPVCTNECLPPEPPPKTKVGTVTSVSFKQVTNILACMRQETVAVEMQPAEPAEKVEGNSKSPMRVLGDATLGSEEFQLRAIVVGNAQQRESARVVRVGLWGTNDLENPNERLRQLGGFAVAQAEYFYDAAGAAQNRDAWMWSMNWRARLKRVALPTDDSARDGLREVCETTLGGDCSRFLDIVDDWGELLTH